MGEAWRLEEVGLVVGRRKFGDASVIPWDSEIFGAPVGMLRIEPGWEGGAATLPARQVLEDWARAQRLAMCGCVVPASGGKDVKTAGELGFRYVDLSLRAVRTCSGLPEAGPSWAGLRVAGEQDHAAVRSMARRAFRAGRYHSDPDFPKELADLRYERWIERGLQAGEVLVLHDADGPLGFMHLTLTGQQADLRLAAVTPELQGCGAGAELYRAALAWARERGADRAVTKMSAANVPVLNLLSGMGFRFTDPEVVLHRHWEWPEQPQGLAD